MLTTTIPLCVDLDGTLIKSDLLWESVALLIRDKPWLIPLLPFWLLKGRAALKRNLAERVTIRPELLPYNQDLLELIRKEREAGRVVVLATASDSVLARSVADYLGLFDHVIGSDGSENLKGKTKLALLQRQFGNEFDYAGNSSADLPIWKECRTAIVVNASSGTLSIARSNCRVGTVLPSEASKWKRLVKALRVYQWVKNILIFVPLATSHQLGNFDLLLKAVISCVSFSFCASSVYLINDITDLESDRQHARKRKRPFASGDLPIAVGLVLAPLLLVAAFALTVLLRFEATLVLGVYFTLTLLYSFWLKRKLLVDVFTLAALYTLRIIAGHAAYGVEISTYLLSFSVFVFLSLGFCKRSSELYNLQQSGREQAARRGYRASDLIHINIYGIATGVAASVVLTLYMNSENVRVLYRHPSFLWLLSPLVLYWISRIWIITARGNMDEDPIIFAAKDPITRMIIILGVAVMFLATRDWLPR
ncbi:MAG: UbiA family prenyltransferase [Acidobacteriaceae bacterium]|nr:UbiA family prenyltransferase [Acidobacteriaceae bacterium]